MGVGNQGQAPAALPPGKTQCPLYRKLSGPHGRSGRVRKVSLSPVYYNSNCQYSNVELLCITRHKQTQKLYSKLNLSACCLGQWCIQSDTQVKQMFCMGHWRSELLHQVHLKLPCLNDCCFSVFIWSHFKCRRPILKVLKQTTSWSSRWCMWNNSVSHQASHSFRQ